MELNRKFFASLRRRRFCGNRRDRFIDSHWQETRAGSRADIRRSRLPALMFRYITINYKTSISLTFKPVASAICSTKIMGSCDHFVWWATIFICYYVLSLGAGIRQLSRLTGVSFGVIQKLAKWSEDPMICQWLFGACPHDCLWSLMDEGRWKMDE